MIQHVLVYYGQHTEWRKALSSLAYHKIEDKGPEIDKRQKSIFLACRRYIFTLFGVPTHKIQKLPCNIRLFISRPLADAINSLASFTANYFRKSCVHYIPTRAPYNVEVWSPFNRSAWYTTSIIFALINISQFLPI